MICDFHTHSDCSDGTCTPRELVELASREGLAALALTDHDDVSGVRPAQARGRELGVEILTGVEISVCEQEGAIQLHLLGLGIDFALLFVSRLELIQDEHKDLASATARVYQRMGPAMVTGAVTTAAAFASIALTDFKKNDGRPGSRVRPRPVCSGGSAIGGGVSGSPGRR